MLHSKEGDKLPFIEELVSKGRRINAQDIQPELSDEAAEYIALFFDINQWRRSNGWGPDRFSLEDFYAYSRHTGTVLSSYSVDILKAIDNLYLSAYNEANKK